jgi:hypothetical protein
MSIRIRQLKIATVATACLGAGGMLPAAALADTAVQPSSHVAHVASKPAPKHKRKHRKHVNHTVTGTRGKNGAQGPAGPQGPQGPAGPAGANGTALGYAKVTDTGQVVASASKNITTANITKIPGAPAYFCFSGLPFTPGTMTATAAFVGSDTDTEAEVELASADPNFVKDTSCPVGTQALVFTHNGGLPKAAPFYVTFS